MLGSPTTYKPHVDGRGRAIMIPVADGTGLFVTKAEYDDLQRRFFQSNRAIADLEIDAPAAEAADGKERES